MVAEAVLESLLDMANDATELADTTVYYDVLGRNVPAVVNSRYPTQVQSCKYPYGDILNFVTVSLSTMKFEARFSSHTAPQSPDLPTVDCSISNVLINSEGCGSGSDGTHRLASSTSSIFFSATGQFWQPQNAN